MNFGHIFVTVLSFILIQKTDQYENLSLNKTATVSQRYNNKDFDPSLAVDGDHSTDLLKCSLTASGQKEAWLTVDLGEERNIASISFIHGGLGTSAKPIDYGTSGIYRSGTSTTVYAGASSRRWLCYDHFTVKNAQVVCLIWGLLPDNGRISFASSTAEDLFAIHNYDCVGNEATIRECRSNVKSCPSSLTSGRMKRTNLNCTQGDTLAGFSVHVSDTTDWKAGTLCYKHDIKQPLNNTVIVDCFTSGRYVTIYNSRNITVVPLLSEFAYINICEINITGCDVGFYGENCTKCPDNCLNETCEVQTGDCFCCKDGFSGRMCDEECPHGQYGKACSSQCGNCLNQMPCNYFNGTCHGGCSSGWTGDKCVQKCPSTLYGPNCNLFCSEHCQNRTCNQSNGYCFACNGARLGNLCENEQLLQASIDTVSFLIATTVLLSALVVAYSLYKLKRKYMSSRQTAERNNDVSEVITVDSKYETLQRKKVTCEVDTHTPGEYMEIDRVKATEYMEISAITSDDIDLNME